LAEKVAELSGGGVKREDVVRFYAMLEHDPRMQDPVFRAWLDEKGEAEGAEPDDDDSR